jgi:hypothetical protein
MVTPDGAPVTRSETGPAKPPPRVIVAVTLALSPWTTEIESADRKSVIDGLGDGVVVESDPQAAATESRKAKGEKRSART